MEDRLADRSSSIRAGISAVDGPGVVNERKRPAAGLDQPWYCGRLRYRV